MQSYDWNTHFKRVSAKPDFGTVGGLHTQAELQNLYDVTKAHMSTLTQGRDALAQSSAWANVDPQGWAQFLTDVANLQNDWQGVDSSTQKYLGILGTNLILSDSAYNDVNTILTRATTLIYHMQQSPAGHSADVTSAVAQLANAPKLTPNSDPINNVPNPAAPFIDPWKFLKDHWKGIALVGVALIGTGLLLNAVGHTAGKLAPLALL